MSPEILKMTVEIVISHASMTELSSQELVEEIKTVYHALAKLECGLAPEITAPGVKDVKQPPIPLKDIVTEKYVVCLECGKKMRTLKAHLKRIHALLPAEYGQRFGLDLKKYPLICKEYSVQRSQIAKDRGLGQGGRKARA